jgi:hypothetical protein
VSSHKHHHQQKVEQDTTMATDSSAQVGTSANDMKVAFTLELRDEDKQNPYRINLANQVIQLMTTAFGADASYITKNEKAITLNVTITACSEGSRLGRICCGELGVGWVVLKLKWHLSKDNKRLTEPTKERFRDSGAIGLADVCADNFGEQTMLTYLASEAAKTIARKASNALSAGSRSSYIIGPFP